VPSRGPQQPTIRTDLESGKLTWRVEEKIEALSKMRKEKIEEAEKHLANVVELL